MHVTLNDSLMENTGHSGPSALWGKQYLRQMLAAGPFLFSDFKAKHGAQIVLLPSWEGHHPSKRTQNVEVWAVIFKTSDFSNTLCFLFFQTCFSVSHTVAASFNNERRFYSVALVQHEHRCPVLDFRGWMKDGPKQMDSMSAQPVRLPFGQQNCPVMDSCALGRAYRKGNHTQYLWDPPGSGDSLTWASHSRQTERKFLTRSSTIHQTFIRHSRSACMWRSS